MIAGLSIAAPFMLWGLLGVGIPVIVHLLSRRRSVTIDWGAMQFLDIGRRARRKLEITELLLMMGRMLLLAVVALALARPLWQPRTSGAMATALGASASEPRDVVLILDDSESMGRRVGGAAPRDLALKWARSFASAMRTGDSVAVLVAKDRVKTLGDGPTYDPARLAALLKSAPPARGSSDLPAALAEAFRLLESGRNPTTEIVLLTDGQRHAWRPGEASRWSLLRDLHKAMRGRSPRIAAVTFASGREPDGPDVAVAPIEMPRGVYPPSAPIDLTTSAANTGPGPASRTAELLVDGVAVPGSGRAVGPIPPGGKIPLTFRATIAAPGAHVLGVRLSGADDALPANDSAERAVEIAEALPVLLVDGEPGSAPLSGETDFLRAALAPAEDEAPAVRARVVPPNALSAESLKGARVLVLANVERLDPGQVGAVTDFVAAGGGLLVSPGDRVDPAFSNQALFAGGTGLLPAELGPMRGEFARKSAVAHPAPRTFTGPVLSPFGSGDAPALAEAGLFAYRVLKPAAAEPPAATVARLDTGDPWAVERRFRSGRVLLLAGPLDAEGGTLPVNPDFVPLVHELIYRLADPAADFQPTPPGQTVRIPLAEPPKAGVQAARVVRPDGTATTAPILREGEKSLVRLDATDEPGIYRIDLPGPSGGAAYAAVASDPRESDPEPLAAAESARLSEGWPLAFAESAEGLDRQIASGGGSGPRPMWCWLVLAALGGLCAEVWMTRSLVKGRGHVPAGEPSA